MADQLVSADPNWAGTPAAPTGPRLSAAHADSALPASDSVTLGDVQADPVSAMKKIGAIVGKDVSDPKLWLTLAASYFAPKIFNVAGPIVARAATKTAAVASEVATPGMAKDLGISVLGNDRVNAGLRIADRLRNAVNATPVEAPPTATSPVAAAPASTAAPVADTPPPPPATASPVSPAPAPAGRPLSPGQTLDLPMAQRTKGQQSASWLQSDLGMAARRQGVALSAAESTAAETLMRDRGVSPNEAVQTVGQLQAARTPSGLTLSPEEATQFAALKQRGQSGAQAEAAILNLRSLAKQLKTPSGETVTDRVQRRNETGRWEKD